MRLIVRLDGAEIEQIESSKSLVTIGAHSTNDIVLTGDEISAYHAQIMENEEGILLFDLGSSNGTFVNSEKIIKPKKISASDKIKIGRYLIFIENVSVVDKSINSGSNSESVFFTPSSIEQVNNDVELKAASKTKSVQRINSKSSLANSNDQKPAAVAREEDTESYFNSKSSLNSDSKPFKKQRKILTDFLFYVILTLMAVIIVLAIIIFSKNGNTEKKQILSVRKAEQPFFLFYEKYSKFKNNIYRFEISVNRNEAVIILDDLKSKRHLAESFKPDKSDLIRLKQAIDETNFIKLEESAVLAELKELSTVRSIKLFNNGILKQYQFRGEFPPASVIKIETAISDFVNVNGFVSLQMTKAEMVKEAEELFSTALNMKQSWQAAPKNLRLAKLRFSRAKKLLSEFDDKPKLWYKAQSEETDVENIIQKRLKSLRFDYEKSVRIEDYPKALKLCVEILDLLDPGSKTYESYKVLKNKLELYLQGEKK